MTGTCVGGTGVGLALGLGLGLGLGERVGLGLGLGVGAGDGEGVGDGLGVGRAVGGIVSVGLEVDAGSALKIGSRLVGTVRVGSATASNDDAKLGLGSTEVGAAPIRPDTNSNTITARMATARNASQSRRAFEGRCRDDGGRGITPVRRSLAADRGSDLAMGSAGYSRIDKQALNGAVWPRR